jgi:hypothetical protein
MSPNPTLEETARPGNARIFVQDKTIRNGAAGSKTLMSLQRSQCGGNSLRRSAQQGRNGLLRIPCFRNLRTIVRRRAVHRVSIMIAEP